MLRAFAPATELVVSAHRPSDGEAVIKDMVITDMVITDVVITDMVITDMVITDMVITDTVIADSRSSSVSCWWQPGACLRLRTRRPRAGRQAERDGKHANLS